MLTNLHKTPWPWFGGKSDAAPYVWDALGDVDHYVEPFAGSLAVLLRRPHVANRSHTSETVNDMDGLLCNAWRAIIHDPDAVAEAASWPVCEADIHARHLALVKWRSERQLEHLMADPDFYDAKMAGWWAWGQSAWIGSGWCSGTGPWVVGEDGRITKKSKNGVHRKIPYMSGGRGINHPNAREEGVSRQVPFMTSTRGGNHAGTREEGVSRQLPHVHTNGSGMNHANLREDGVGDEPEYHPMTMPELTRWLRFLSARLRHVRVINGDWKRVVTDGVLNTLSVNQGGYAGVFLDPPYTDEVRTGGIYAVDSGNVAHDVREWCKANGDNPKHRIILAGYDTEHQELETQGWTAVEWYREGFLKGGMANISGSTQQKRERLWLSPHCLGVQPTAQISLF
jgi:site-specific DNA-adenine methylase